MSEQRTVRRSLKNPRKGKTDWKRVDALTDKDIERAVANDPDAAPLFDEEWFKDAELVYPDKQMISIRLDGDVLKHFRGTGPRWQTRINSVLKAYIKAKDKKRA
ncbi:MAG TPA: BrnA antitoxin family protein [Magnetospirillaceae bacterium]